MISSELYDAVWKFIERRSNIGELWACVNELPIAHTIDSEESDLFAAVCTCEVYLHDNSWSMDDACRYLRQEMSRHLTVYARWEGP